MLTITDLGCDRHKRRQVILNGVEAEMMADFLYNLIKDGDFHTYICAYGHTHRISFNNLEEKLSRISDLGLQKDGTFRKTEPWTGPGQPGEFAPRNERLNRRSPVAPVGFDFARSLVEPEGDLHVQGSLVRVS